jgi:hypothetical protein
MAIRVRPAFTAVVMTRVWSAAVRSGQGEAAGAFSGRDGRLRIGCGLERFGPQAPGPFPVALLSGSVGNQGAAGSCSARPAIAGSGGTDATSRSGSFGASRKALGAVAAEASTAACSAWRALMVRSARMNSARAAPR